MDHSGETQCEDRDEVESVRLEMLSLLADTGECELRTLYRSVIAQLGTKVVARIGELLRRLIREGVVQVDTRTAGPEGPPVDYARLTRFARPPYEALCA